MVLNYKKFGEGFPLIILHGLLGSLDNWQSIAKAIVEKLPGLCVYIVDQRNHGKSPHSSEFNYSLLVNDLFDFMQQQQIDRAHLLGHSMGGKAVMQFALDHHEKVEKLIVADISPSFYAEDRHDLVFEALINAGVDHAKTREDVQQNLRRHLKDDETTIFFLMKGLYRDTEDGEGFRWRFNVTGLWENYERICEGVSSTDVFNGPVLFLKGEHSRYINAGNYPDMIHFFPHHELTEIKNAGHWLHADNPADFVNEVVRFLKN